MRLRFPVYAALLLAIIAATRLPYTHFVWADEGLWFTAAQELLRGKALYSQIWFDKPPGVAWIYAALFKAFGPSLLAVRIFTVLYALAVALALHNIARTFWGEHEARLAALLWAVYNATWIHAQVQPLAVDHLVLLPYLLSGVSFLRGRPFLAGIMAAMAFSLNPKAGVLAMFFAAVEFIWPSRGKAWRWTLTGLGFVSASLPWVVYLASGRKWSFYLRDVWGWGFSYISVNTPAVALLEGARRTLNYFGFHFALLLGLALLVLYHRHGAEAEPAERRFSHVLWLWVLFGFVGISAGGRFFPRYYYQITPLLCLLAARGYGIARHAVPARRWQVARALMIVALLFSVARFHSRAAAIVYEKVTGRQTSYMARWDDPAMDRDSRVIAQHVSGRIFVWGYRSEIYFYCQCRPASPFLSSQPLTGVPADIHLRQSLVVAPAFAAENRLRLLMDLRRSRPDYIVDGLAPYNPRLAMDTYPEYRDFLDRYYVRGETIGHGVIYTVRAEG